MDQGYDVSDYCGVDPLFGTMDQFDQLLESAHALGLRIFLDVAPNHCSSQHPLFQAAVAAGPGSPERAMFHFAAGSDDGAPPNNWQSVFGGSAWSRVHPDSDTDREWCLHLFSPEQPDWNWRNPAVGNYFEGVLRFWFDKGVDGLRSNPEVSDQEEVHEVYRRWRRVADSYSPGRVLVGEVNLAPDRAARHTRPDEMHQAFAFAFVKFGWDTAAGTELEAARKKHGAPPTWALENHDISRSVTRFGGGDCGVRRARAGLVAILGLPGGAYIYQGQELSLPDVDVPLHVRVDPMWARAGVSRDGARVPLPRTTAPDSTLQLAAGALRLRTELLAKGIFTPNDASGWQVRDNGLLLCERGDRILLAVAMGEGPCPLPDGRVLLSSSPLTPEGQLPPDTAAWILRHQL